MNFRRSKFERLNIKFGSEIEKHKKQRFLELEQWKENYYSRTWWPLSYYSAGDDEINQDHDLDSSHSGFKKTVRYTYNTKLLELIAKRGHITIEFDQITTIHDFDMR